MFTSAQKLALTQQAQYVASIGLLEVALYSTAGVLQECPKCQLFYYERELNTIMAGNHYLALANDPTDPNYASLTIPSVQPPALVVGVGAPLSASSISLMNQCLAMPT